MTGLAQPVGLGDLLEECLRHGERELPRLDRRADVPQSVRGVVRPHPAAEPDTVAWVPA